jgi:translation initiation factor IF-3
LDINTDLMINEGIRDREVRVVDSNGTQLGIMPTQRALELAEEARLDLVKIAPNAQPPVCKLMDYDKHRFEQAKREKEMRKKSAHHFRQGKYSCQRPLKKTM